MTLLIALMLLVMSGVAAMTLSRFVATRLLGIIAGAAAVPAAVSLLFGPIETPPALVLFELGAMQATVLPAIGLQTRALAVMLLLGAAAAQWLLAAALPLSLRGFGAIFGWGQIAVAATLISLAAPAASVLVPLTWAVTMLAAHAARVSSGVAAEEDGPPANLVTAALAITAISGFVAWRAALPATDLPPTGLALAVIAAALALAGAPPLTIARAPFASAPLPLQLLIGSLVLPTLGIGYLTQFLNDLPTVPPLWGNLLLIIGLAGAPAAALGALSAGRLRLLVLWLSAAQVSAVVIALALGDPLAVLAAPSLLAGAMISSVILTAAATVYERQVGSDQLYIQSGTAVSPWFALIWLLGVLAAVGVPPFFTFWGRLWLFEAVAAQYEHLAWAVPLAAGLLLPAGLWPLGRFFAAQYRRAGVLLPFELTIAGVAAFLLAMLGLWPELAWSAWLSWLSFAPPALPVDPSGRLLLLTALLPIPVLWWALRAPAPPRAERDIEEEPVYLPPAALISPLRHLLAAADATPLLQLGQRLIDSAGHVVQSLIAPFEQRYYLLGVLAALISIMLLMAQ
jgi:hypothetical protein